MHHLALIVEFVAMPEQAAGRLSGPAAHTRPRRHLHPRHGRLVVGREQADGVQQRHVHFDRASESAVIGIRARPLYRRLTHQLHRLGRQTIEIVVQARRGTDPVGLVVKQPMQRSGMGHLKFAEVLREFAHVDVEAAVRNDTAIVHRIFVGSPQGDARHVPRHLGQLETADPTHQSLHMGQRLLRLVQQQFDLAA